MIEVFVVGDVECFNILFFGIGVCIEMKCILCKIDFGVLNLSC